jgi:fluoride ion exporter CrcB/FEX
MSQSAWRLTMQGVRQRSFLLALAYTVGSVVLGQLAVVVGMILARLF